MSQEPAAAAEPPHELPLTFPGPFVLIDNQTEPTLSATPFGNRSGLYLWVVPDVRGGYIVTYVGETAGSFSQRTKEHVIQTIGGN